MTSQTIVPRALYAANGVQTAFGFTFPVFDARDMEVWIGQTLQPGSAYTISGVGVAVGGTVIFAVPPPASSQVTLRRRMPLNRVPEFPDTSVQAKPLNEEFIYHTAALQQLADETSLAVKRSFRSLSNADLTLPEPVAGRAIRWNDAGDGLINSAANADSILAQSTAYAQACAADTADASISKASAASSAAAAAASAIAAHDSEVAAAAAAANVQTWKTISVAGQSDVVADQVADSLTLAAGANVALTTNAGTDTITISVTGLGSAGTATLDTDGTLAANSDSAVASQKAVRTYVAANGIPSSLYARIAFLEKNLAVNTLRDQIDTGWSVLKMVDGIADEFEDETGIGTNTNGTYDSTGDYYHNPALTGVNHASGITPTSNRTAIAGALSNLTDGSTGTYWQASGSSGGPDYLHYDLGSAKSLGKLRLYKDGNSVWDTYTVKASATGSFGGEEVTVGSGTVTSATGWFEFTLTGASYRYVRLYMSGSKLGGNTNWPWLIETEIIGADIPAPSMTLLSQAYTAGTSPTEARLVLLHQPMVSTTLNTDCTIEASRDGGTTWTVGTLANDGAFDSNTNIVSATIDLTAQPSGTSMKWRFKTFNAKTQRLHGVWLQWR